MVPEQDVIEAPQLSRVWNESIDENNLQEFFALTLKTTGIPILSILNNYFRFGYNESCGVEGSDVKGFTSADEHSQRILEIKAVSWQKR